MAEQSKNETYSPSESFADGASARPLVVGTVPRGGVPVTANGGIPATRSIPAPPLLAAGDVERGHERFDIYCAACHGRLGDGNGMIPQRGLTRPPSFYSQRLRDAGSPHVYDTITYGHGAMYSLGDAISSDDRWRIAAYVRALQLGAPDLRGPDIATPSTDVQRTAARSTGVPSDQPK